MFYEQSENPCLVHHEFCRLQNMLVQEMKLKISCRIISVSDFFALIFTILVQILSKEDFTK